MSEDDVRPLFRVVRGAPTPEELAALTAVLTARAAAMADDPVPSEWTNRAGLARSPVRPGRGAWIAWGRASGVRTRADW